jgi:hypothetical protein
LIKRLLKYFRRVEYPYSNEEGVRWKIIGDGVIHVDIVSLVNSPKFREQLKALKDIKLRKMN